MLPVALLVKSSTPGVQHGMVDGNKTSGALKRILCLTFELRSCFPN